MAITAPTDNRRQGYAADHSFRNPLRARSLLPAAGLLAGLLAAGSAPAQQWATSASIDGNLTATSNANFGASGNEESDVIAEVSPRISFFRQGARLRLSGDASLSASTYANSTQASRITPALALGANLEAIEQFFFIDSRVNVQQSAESPFGPRPTAGSRINSERRYEARVSPFVSGRVGTRWRYQLRDDSTWVRTSGGAFDQRDQFAHQQVAEVSLIPAPVGLTFSYNRNQSDFEGNSQARQTVEIGRLIVSYGDERFSAGVRGGWEKNKFPGFATERTFYGGNVSWRPTERTNLSAFVENRFFGTGWSASFDHRMPRLAWSIRSSRDVSTFPQRAFSLPVAFDVADLINASLITRIPDPVERARAVEEFMVSRGLPRTLITPIDIYTERAELRASHIASLVMYGTRNSLALNLYSSRTEGITTAIGPLPIPAALLDNRQQGIGLSFSHQLSGRTGFGADASFSQTRGLAAASDSRSREHSYGLRLNHTLSPKTTLTTGARYRRLDSTVQNDADEVAAYVGIGHRF